MKNVWIITLLGNRKIEAENVRLRDGFITVYKDTTRQVIQKKKVKKLFRTVVKDVSVSETMRVFTHLIPPHQVKMIELREGTNEQA